MDAERLLDRINERHGADFRLHGRYARGENQGAYAIVDTAGTFFVLKHRPRPHPYWRGGLERARWITERLRGLGSPVPSYRGEIYWIQSALPGTPPEVLTESQLQQLLALNDLQAGQAISQEQDWSSYIVKVVFAGESGWADTLHQHSAATRDVLGRLERLAAGKHGSIKNAGDIVHGDMNPDNVLVCDGQISGIVDWDAAGCGDRTLDLAGLLFYSYTNLPIRRRLQDRIIELTSRDALHVYMAYKILGQLDWSIHHHPQTSINEGVDLAHTIFHNLESKMTPYGHHK